MMKKNKTNTTSLSSLIAKFHRPMFYAPPHIAHIIDEGGRASTKTSKNALRVIKNMLDNPTGEWVVLRQDFSQHATSTLRELQRACERLGLVHGVDFKIVTTSMKLEFMATGQQIRFGAMNDVEKVKGFAPSSNKMHFAGVWFFEITEFKDYYDMSQVISTFLRGFKPRGFVSLYEFNPHNNPFHWTKKWVEMMSKRRDVQYTFSTYLNLTKEEMINWLGIDMLKEIRNTMIYDPDSYKHIYLGKPLVLSGAIYKKLSTDIIKEYDIDKFTEFHVGFDFGVRDATSVILVGFENLRHVHCEDMYYHRNLNNTIQKTAEEIMLEVKQQLLTWYQKYQKVITIHVDNRDLSIRLNLLSWIKEKQLDDCFIVKRANKQATRMFKEERGKETSALLERIQFTCLLLSQNRLTIDKRCLPLFEEMSIAEWIKDKSGDAKRKDSDTSPVDCQDSFEYAVRQNLELMRKFMLRQQT